MGQTVSYKKKYQSAIFGYTTTTPVYIKPEKEEDNVLFKPYLYGLSIQSTPSLNCPNTRADSGFLLCEKDSRLWKDLIYVDQTYYEQENKIKIIDKRGSDVIGDTLTFDDILHTTQINSQELILSRRGFGIISSNIGLLTMIKKLDLSSNQLKEIPKEIGHLNRLEILNVSHNQIKTIPDTICHLTQLIELNFSYNQLEQVTPFLSHLRSLKALHLDHNELKEISVDQLSQLNLLDLSYNPIRVLPAEIIQLPFLRRLRLDGCDFLTSLDEFPVIHNPPSLLETCARTIIQHEDQIRHQLSGLPDPLYQYLTRFKTCSFCHGPYFDSYISRGRWIERNEAWVPLEYRLCSAHWSNEEERVYTMFSTVATPIKSSLRSKPELGQIQPEFLRASTKHQRKSQTNPPDLPSSSTVLSDINHSVDQHPLDTLDSPISAIKRWKFKIQNNNSFLKKHRLKS